MLQLLKKVNSMKLNLKKATSGLAILTLLGGFALTAQAFTAYSQESHGSLGLTGAYEQYYTNYSTHTASVTGSTGQSATQTKTANYTAYASIDTGFGETAYFFHWDN